MTLSTTNITGAAMYILSITNTSIQGTIDLDNILTAGNRSDNFVYATSTQIIDNITAPGVSSGGAGITGGSCGGYSGGSGGAQSNGYGGGGGGGAACVSSFCTIGINGASGSSGSGGSQSGPHCTWNYGSCYYSGDWTCPVGSWTAGGGAGGEGGMAVCNSRMSGLHASGYGGAQGSNGGNGIVDSSSCGGTGATAAGGGGGGGNAGKSGIHFYLK